MGYQEQVVCPAPFNDSAVQGGPGNYYIRRTPVNPYAYKGAGEGQCIDYGPPQTFYLSDDEVAYYRRHPEVFELLGTGALDERIFIEQIAAFTSWETAQIAWTPNDQWGPSRIWGGTSWLAFKAADYPGTDVYNSPNEIAAKYVREQAWTIYDALVAQNAKPERNPDQIALAISRGIISNPWDAPGFWGWSPASGSSFSHGLNIIAQMMNEPTPLARRNGTRYVTPPELQEKARELTTAAMKWAWQTDQRGKTPTGIKAALPIASIVLAVVGIGMALVAAASAIGGAAGTAAAGSAAGEVAAGAVTGAAEGIGGAFVEGIGGGFVEGLGTGFTEALGTGALDLSVSDALFFSGIDPLGVDLLTLSGYDIGAGLAPTVTEGASMFDFLDFTDIADAGIDLSGDVFDFTDFADAMDFGDLTFDQVINDIPGFDVDFSNVLPDATDFADLASTDLSDIGNSIFGDSGTSSDLLQSLRDIPGYGDAEAVISASGGGGSPVDWITKLIRAGADAYKTVMQARRSAEQVPRPLIRPTSPRPLVPGTPGAPGAPGAPSVITAPLPGIGLTPLQLGIIIGGGYLVTRAIRKGK